MSKSIKNNLNNSSCFNNMDNKSSNEINTPDNNNNLQETEIDTPEVMKLYGKNLKSDDLDWSFLTTKSYRELNPIIEAYSQPVIRKYDDSGNYKGVDSHILRVFLIDSNKVVRNIYSVSFLHSKLLINDIINLSLEK